MYILKMEKIQNQNLRYRSKNCKININISNKLNQNYKLLNSIKNIF